MPDDPDVVTGSAYDCGGRAYADGVPGSRVGVLEVIRYSAWGHECVDLRVMDLYKISNALHDLGSVTAVDLAVYCVVPGANVLHPT